MKLQEYLKMDVKKQNDSQNRLEKELQTENRKEPVAGLSDQDSMSSQDFSTVDDTGATEEEKIPEKKKSENTASGTEFTDAERIAESDSFDPNETAEGRRSPQEEAASDKISTSDDNVLQVEDAKEHQQAQGLPESKREAESDDIAEQEEQKISAPSISRTKIAVSVTLVLALFSGFFIFENKSATRMAQKEKSKTVENKANRLGKQPETLRHIQPTAPDNRYHAKLNEIKALREVLLGKKEDIEKLKKHYRKGIEELENEVSDELQMAQVNTFLEAMGSKRVEFALRTAAADLYS